RRRQPRDRASRGGASRSVRAVLARPHGGDRRPPQRREGDGRMNVIKTEKNPEALTFTAVVEFDAGPERLWQMWEDPRKLEKWWGPPTWPATFERHEFEPGGRASYYMTGP